MGNAAWAAEDAAVFSDALTAERAVSHAGERVAAGYRLQPSFLGSSMRCMGAWSLWWQPPQHSGAPCLFVGSCGVIPAALSVVPVLSRKASGREGSVRGQHEGQQPDRRGRCPCQAWGGQGALEAGARPGAEASEAERLAGASPELPSGAAPPRGGAACVALPWDSLPVRAVPRVPPPPAPRPAPLYLLRVRSGAGRAGAGLRPGSATRRQHGSGSRHRGR